MSRFVLLRHEMPPEASSPSHWDLMLEQGDALVTWRLAQLPAAWLRAQQGPAGDVEPRQVTAVRLADHRLAYLDCEGPVSGDRGEVRRVDGGLYHPEDVTSIAWHIRLFGEAVRGRVKLEHVGSNEWRLVV